MCGSRPAPATPSPCCGPTPTTHSVRKGSIAGGADAKMFGPHTAKLLRAALGTGIDARASRDAGSYLCNYLSWRAIEATCADDGPRLAAFVHVPPIARDGASHRKGMTPRITLEQLVDAGEAMLLEMVKLTRAPLTLPPTIAPRAARPSPCFAAILRYVLAIIREDSADHGRQSPASDRGLRGRRCRRAGDVAGCRARGAADLGARARRHAIWRAARQPRRPDPRAAARDRRGRARASAARAAAGRLPHRHAAAFQRHAADRRARRDQTGLHRRRVDVFGRRRKQHWPCQHHARRRRHPAADAARPGALPWRPRYPHHRLRDRQQRRQRHLVRERLRRCQRQHFHQHRGDRRSPRSTRRA